MEKYNSIEMAIGKNGKKYVRKEDVDAVFHCTDGNSKTGRAGNYNLPIEYTCDHNAPCYKDGVCYGECGFYTFKSNQANYTENYNFYRSVATDIFVKSIVRYIMENNLDKFRYFTCGDIPDTRFLAATIEVAHELPTVEYWLYTKKYEIVNKWCDEHGVDSIPSNLTIIFSHWCNDDGTYYPMNNPYNFPTSEFIPLGKEYLTEHVTHVCPCSDPDSVAQCATCDHPCYRLKHGESMALLEHSTSRTKARDKALKEAKKAKKSA